MAAEDLVAGCLGTGAGDALELAVGGTHRFGRSAGLPWPEAGARAYVSRLAVAGRSAAR